ncbi:MAG: hypothetical protein Q7N87_02105 [Candidatus Uhrbacteria bacterium]|nr:hypothetical protein [Candidatus Uhrbacteria bacterium]
MNTLFRVLGSIYFLIWSIIGIGVLIALFAGFVFVKQGGPSQMMSSFLPMMGGGGSGSQEQDQVSAELKACAVKILGEKRTNELLNGSQPSASEMQKLSAGCSNFLPKK